MDNFFNKSIDDCLKILNSSFKGLTTEDAQNILNSVGANTLKEQNKKSIFSIFIEQFKDFLVVILIIAAIVSALTGNGESAIVIISVITLNSFLGTFQYIKADQSLNSLKALSSPCAKVIRDGIKVEIDSKEVVPGDIMLLEAGDLVVADGRLIESFSLKVNESSLTGESEVIEKNCKTLNENNIPLGDQKNMVFSSSLVTYGRATVLVTKTGMNSQLGKIASLMEITQEKSTPLQISLDEFSKKLAFGIIAICILVFGLSMYHGTNVLDSLMFAVALAVAAIPEALSSIITIVLAIGTQNMAAENAIIKKLKAVESLGCVSIICSDKTGTLTQNKMTVQKLFVHNELIDNKSLNMDNPSENFLLKSAVLCNDATSLDDNLIGDPTEIALTNLGHIYSINELICRETYPRLDEIPFDSDRKLMSTLHNINGKIYMITKGALDVILEKVTYIDCGNEIKNFTELDKNNIININKELSVQGLRVLAFAYKEMNSASLLSLDDEYGYTFLGLISMIDPPREESKEAVANCIKASIKPIMITGDHKITASAIAKEIGIMTENDIAIDGLELDKMSDHDLDAKLDNISVYARVSPEHKIRIVNAWQKRNNIVAMTGDGVNDAPALKKADIGIAMGITGTEVSKDAASIILTDDNFATIIKAVGNGRNIYSNIKNSIKFLLSGNISGILSVLYASLLGLSAPFAPVHLLFINLLTDSLPAIAIGMEKSSQNVLNEKPRNIKESILTKDFLISILIQGLIMGIFTMLSYYAGLTSGSTGTAMTMAFTTLCIARLFHGFNCRSKDSILSIGLFSNIYSILAFIIGICLINLVLFIPLFQQLFQVTPLSNKNIMLIYLFGFLPTLIIQSAKIVQSYCKQTYSHKNQFPNKKLQQINRL